MADRNSHEHTLSRTSFERISAISWLWAVGGKAHGFHVATGWTKRLISSIQRIPPFLEATCMTQLGNLSSYSCGVLCTVHLTSTGRLPCARTLYLVNTLLLAKSENTTNLPFRESCISDNWEAIRVIGFPSSSRMDSSLVRVSV